SPRSSLAAAAVLALVVGTVGGFALGRSSAPKPSTTVAARAPGHAGEATTPSTGAFAYGGASQAKGGDVVGGPAAPSYTRIFDRTTSEGIDIHAFVQSNDLFAMPSCPPEADCAAAAGVNQGAGCPQDVWCPPAECYASSLLVELASDKAVGQSGAPAYPATGPASIVAPIFFGQMEGAPANGLAVRTADGVTDVRAQWPDGFADSMAPAGGWAVVVHQGTDSPSSVVVEGPDGPTTISVTNGMYAQPPAECQPPPPRPPTLPPAGAEQPDDLAAATQAVADAYSTVFTHGSDPEQIVRLVEDGGQMQDLFATAKQNFPEATDTITVTIGEIRFVSRTEAALLFELHYQGGALFGQQIGYAKLIDGTWKVSRETVCM